MSNSACPWRAVGMALALSAGAAAAAPIGERPAIEKHVDQAQVESGRIKFKELFELGELLFDARFNALDGQGRPASRGNGNPRLPDEPFMIRTSGPDANSCFGCHSQPRSGGAGDFVANVFVLAQNLDPVTESVSGEFSNERNTLGMMGSGPIEMLAREMTSELLATRDAAAMEARISGQAASRRLVAKGVDFGTVRVMPDGRIDPTGIVGVDWDLVVKPFHQKGAVVSLREFTNNAMNHHHGMQSVERFGVGTDPDGDGVFSELTLGDITAATIYQAALGTPGRVMPRDNDARRAVARGEAVFGQIGCSVCHIPELTLNSPAFTEPNPFNPVGNLGVSAVSRVFSFDMTREGEKPRLERLRNGKIPVRAFTDLKRHNLNDEQFNHFANERVPQGTLAGNAPATNFTVAPVPRPTDQFLTRKLWDVGNTGPYGHRGDLTTMTEAIYFHGGEGRVSRDAFFALPQGDRNSVIEFLRTLQIVAEK